MKFSFSLILLLFLFLVSILSPGCSCSTNRIAKSKKVTKITHTKKIKKKFINPLSMYIKEIKFIRKKNRMKKIKSMRSIYSTRKEIMSQRTDFLEMHGFLKNGVKLFKAKKYNEALKEFQRVIEQYPEDINLQTLATKNISICYDKLGNKDEFLKYYKKYYELLDKIPDDKDEY